MRKPCKLFITVLLFITILPGCWSRQELDDLAIAFALGLDRSDDGYHLSMQTIIPSELALTAEGSGHSPVVTYETQGKTVFEAVRKMATDLPRRIHAGYVRILVISDDLAREGIADLLDILIRDHQYRPDFHLIIARNHEAKDVLKVVTPLDRIPANKLHNSLEVAENAWGSTSSGQLDEVISELVNPGKQVALSGIRIIGNPKKGQSTKNLTLSTPDTRLIYQGVGIFREDRLVGWLNEKESIGYNLTQGKTKTTLINIPCKNQENIGIELIRSSANIQVESIQNKPQATIHIQVEGNIGEVECDMNTTGTRALEQLNSQLKKQIHDMVLQFVKRSQSLQSDIFGMGNALNRSHPQQWEQLKNDWPRHYQQLPVSVQVKAQISQSGSTTQSVHQKMEETH